MRRGSMLFLPQWQRAGSASHGARPRHVEREASRGSDYSGPTAYGGIHGVASATRRIFMPECCSSRSAWRRSSSARTTRSAPPRAWARVLPADPRHPPDRRWARSLALRALRLQGSPFPAFKWWPTAHRAGQRRGVRPGRRAVGPVSLSTIGLIVVVERRQPRVPVEGGPRQRHPARDARRSGCSSSGLSCSCRSGRCSCWTH